jgi:hypothetical protein
MLLLMDYSISQAAHWYNHILRLILSAIKTLIRVKTLKLIVTCPFLSVLFIFNYGVSVSLSAILLNLAKFRPTVENIDVPYVEEGSRQEQQVNVVINML